jgi:hypothetical protein
MSASAHTEHRPAAAPGRRVAIASLLMIPATVLLYPILYLVGAGLQSALDLADDELLVDAGALGVAAAALMLLLTALPQIVGVVLGVRARRSGDPRLGAVGVAANAIVGGFFLLSSLLQLVLG